MDGVARLKSLAYVSKRIRGNRPHCVTRGMTRRMVDEMLAQAGSAYFGGYEGNLHPGSKTPAPTRVVKNSGSSWNKGN